MKGFTGLLKKRIINKDVLITGAIMDSRSGAVIEMFHDIGCDVILIDKEHTALDNETVLEHIRLCRALDIPCMVRVPEPSYSELNRTIDQAPDGIYVPRIRTRQEVENIIKTVKYPPLGIRGMGGSTCPAGKYIGWGSLEEQIKYFNNEFVIGIQIETAEALTDLDGILSVPSIDLAVVGIDDITIGLGIPGQTENPKFISTVKEIITVCNKYNVLPGIPCGDSIQIRFWKEQGMRVFWSMSDISSLWAYNKQSMEAIRAELAKPD